MIKLQLVLFAAAGGALGSALRYITGVKMQQWFGAAFPWGVFAVNVAGSFLMGLAMSLLIVKMGVSDNVRVFITVGVLGGLTTFSSFSLDMANFINAQQTATAMTYMLSSIALGLAALFCGQWVGRLF